MQLNNVRWYAKPHNGGSSGGGTNGNYALSANVYSKADADGRFITIDYFNSLFKSYNGTTEIKPNNFDGNTINNIKANYGFWSESYISALGNNSTGGGSGGGVSLNEPLNTINSTFNANPTTSGQTLVWNGTGWIYGTAGGASVLNDLTDVSIITTGTGALANGNILTYDSSSSKWINAVKPTYSLSELSNVTFGTGTDAPANGHVLAYDGTKWTNISGYATETWVESNYLSISFFRSLFKAYQSDGTTEVMPNAGNTSTIDNIKAMFGFWTNAYISALGNNSSGGGGGGSTTLSGLTDVYLTDTSNGDVLTYNSSSHKWVNGSGYAKTSDLAGFADTISVNGASYTATNHVITLPNYPNVPTWAMQPNPPSYSLNNLNDVTINNSTLANGNILTYDSSSSKWINAVKPTYSLNELSNVSIITTGTGALATGDVLVYNGTNWINKSDYATETWVETNYISKSFFNSLFEVYDSNDNPITPNNTSNSPVDNIKSLVGFWTNSYISALGLNSSGGGSSGVSYLRDLQDVAINNNTLANGDLLSYNSSQGKWVNASGYAKTSDLNNYVLTTDLNNTLASYVQTSTLTANYYNKTDTNDVLEDYSWIEDNTTNQQIHIGDTNLYIYNWALASSKPSYNFSEIGSKPTTLSGYGITDARITAEIITNKKTITLGLNSVDIYSWATASSKPSYAFSEITGTATFNQLPTLYWADVQVSSSSNATTTPQFGAVKIDNGSNTGSQLTIGHGNNYGYIVQDATNHLYMSADAGITFGCQDYDPLQVTGDGYVWVTDNSRGLRIGDGLITWDSANQALKIQKLVYNQQMERWDATTGDLYATGGISALGNGPSGSGNTAAISTLADVVLTSLSNGQILSWNGSKWVNTTPSSGTDMSTVWTNLAANTNEQINISHLADALTNYVTTSTSSLTNYYTKTDSDSRYALATTLSNYYTKTESDNKYITSVSGTFWGQSWANGGTVSGSMTGIGSIQMGTYLSMNTTNQKPGLLIEGYWESSSGVEYVTLGYHAASGNTSWQSVDGQDAKIIQLMIEPNGTIAKKYALFKDAVRIGDGMLTWDSSKNAFEIIKSDGTAANLYATGGVSALGFSTGSGSLSSFTINNLTTNHINIGNCDIYEDDGELFVTSDQNDTKGSIYLNRCVINNSIAGTEIDDVGNIYSNYINIKTPDTRHNVMSIDGRIVDSGSGYDYKYEINIGQSNYVPNIYIWNGSTKYKLNVSAAISAGILTIA